MENALTFICCIEFGALEQQVLRFAESLRRWGGAFSTCPIQAYRVRPGLNISNDTKARLKEFNVDLITEPASYKYCWLGTLNKVKALQLAEGYVTTPQMCWMDSDTLVILPPEELVLDSNHDFCACARDKDIGSEGFGDPHDQLFQELYKLFKIPIETVPWVTVEGCGRKIRSYWNAGVFTIRRGLNFGDQFMEVCQSILKNGLGKPLPTGFFFTDQLGLPIAVMKGQFRSKSLPMIYNTPVDVNSQRVAEDEMLKKSCIVHYHRSMELNNWDQFIKAIQVIPQVAKWIGDKGPITDSPYSKLDKFTASAWRYLRLMNKHWYERSCKNCFL